MMDRGIPLSPIIFPVIRRLLTDEQWERIGIAAAGQDCEAIPEALAAGAAGPGAPRYLSDLSRIELARNRVLEDMPMSPQPIDIAVVNPALRLVECSWTGLAAFFQAGQQASPAPRPGGERLLVWRHPVGKTVEIRSATDQDLLALKMTMERISAEAAAREGGVPIAAVEAALNRAALRGLIIAPQPALRRAGGSFPQSNGYGAEYVVAPAFTLQWHITQSCDLHCKHCYDRTDRAALSRDAALHVLDGLAEFCRKKRVTGAISFTGGNPLLHPDFFDIYRAAADRGFSAAILGNPAPRAVIDRIVRIQPPAFFQVSLEGLRDHNDSIRGAGHFDRVVAFLALLKEFRVPSMVMLTLTSENLDQVLPLADFLRGKTGAFHFNRLSLTGEGAGLRLPEPAAYRRFLTAYVAAAEYNAIMGLKDNLINILRRERGQAPFGGCSGYGCGAAFNFLSLLPDGEVHACRKFPSFIGNIGERSLIELYDSEEAARYRRGPAACRNCPVSPVCRGCFAVVSGLGGDIYRDKDPFCFFAAGIGSDGEKCNG